MTYAKSVFVEIREWRDTVNGNTYSTSQIWANGKIVAVNTRNYGDAEMRLYEAKTWLVEMALIPSVGFFSNLQDHGIDFYTATRRGKKSELHKNN